MNICMFTNTYLPHVGGVARSVAAFTEDLKKRGHQVLVVAPEFDGEPRDPEDEVLRIPAIQNFNGSDFSVRLPLPFVIDQKISRFGPDLIHSHHPFLMGDSAMRTAKSRDIPLVFTHHTRYEEYTHYVSSDSELMKRFVIHLCTEYANLCSQVVAPSRSIARLIRERGVHRPISEIPTGVDIDFFQTGNGSRFRKTHQIPADCFVIGHLGRLAPEKNLDYLGQAVVEFMDKQPQARFLVVGAGPSRKSLAARFEKKGLADRLILAGKLTGPDLADAYQAMDAFVFASKSETQGMVLAEAMAAGKPVIALDATGVREVVADGKNGRLLSGDAAYSEFARAIDQYWRDADKRKQWANGALETAQDFSREHCAQKMETLYQTVLERRESRAVSRDGLDEVLKKLRTEWDLLSQKASAFSSSVIRDGEE